MEGSILRVKNLSAHFFTGGGVIRAVDGVSFEVRVGETLGIVGESGSGKSVTALSILRLLPDPGRIVGGEISVGPEGQERDVLAMSDQELRAYRGGDVAMIFQDPMTSLNPVLRVGDQVEEAMRAHHRFTPHEAAARVLPLFRQVRIPDPEARVRSFPHEFSGGMRQRVMIAMGLANEPNVLLADEPTTALDVTVQAQVIALLKDLNREMGTAIVLITHNLAVVASLCTRVVVMYAGRVVEEGPTKDVFRNPQHPYTWSLLRSLPRVDEERRTSLVTIEGLPPDPSNMPPGCKFHPRCPFRVERCFSEEPPLEEVAEGQKARCWVLMANTAEAAAGAS